MAPGDCTGELPGELLPQVVERHARAAAAWLCIEVVDLPRFVRAVAARLDPQDLRRSLDTMRTDDLYLACGCAAGDPAALAAFERQCGPAIAQALATAGASAEERDELGQVIRQRLLVAPGGAAPRIATYAARGSLAAWVRVVAAREAARMLPRARREVATEDDKLADLIAGDGDPEFGYLKRLYRDEFKRAFHAAVDALGARERLVLRQHALDALTIDQLAALHRVHRATAARWVQAAHAGVLAGTERELMRRLRLTRSELASVMRLIQSRLEISLERVLQA
jgi:RNA polymerase sigma-70 factor (ECF subfamily)